jgi:hypothetical protein
MAAEIHQMDSNIARQRNTSPTDSKEKDLAQADVLDIDAEAYAEGENEGDLKVPLYRADKTELTPVEAFTWDVTGGQSPC